MKKRATKAHYFALDDTLRYLYYALRHRKGRVLLMAIEFKHNGRLWRADSVEEAIKLRKQLEANEDEAGMMGLDPDFPEGDTFHWSHDEVSDVLNSLGTLQKKFLLSLDLAEKESTQIVKEMKLDSEVALAGVLSGLSKQVKKHKRKANEVYSVRVQWDGREKMRYFKIGWQFRLSAMEMGWPDKWK